MLDKTGEVDRMSFFKMGKKSDCIKTLNNPDIVNYGTRQVVFISHDLMMKQIHRIQRLEEMYVSLTCTNSHATHSHKI